MGKNQKFLILTTNLGKLLLHNMIDQIIEPLCYDDSLIYIPKIILPSQEVQKRILLFFKRKQNDFIINFALLQLEDASCSKIKILFVFHQNIQSFELQDYQPHTKFQRQLNSFLGIISTIDNILTLQIFYSHDGNIDSL